jgi:hypothetical protein
MTIEDLQRKTCARFNAEFLPVLPGEKVGIAEGVSQGLLPINGLRHPPANGTSGWYLWAGEQMSQDPNFFKPLHAEHLDEWCPIAQKYLGLPPGWRFLVADDYEDVWFDPTLLDVDAGTKHPD